MFSVPQCLSCKHYDKTSRTCAAFPEGIPSEIILGKFDHTKEYPGDGGIRYEKEDE